MGGASRGRGWAPKLQWQYLNMTCTNADLVYNYLADDHTPNLRKVDTKEAMLALHHAWSQRGESMRIYKVEHAPPASEKEKLPM